MFINIVWLDIVFAIVYVLKQKVKKSVEEKQNLIELHRKVRKKKYEEKMVELAE